MSLVKDRKVSSKNEATRHYKLYPNNYAQTKKSVASV